MPDYLNHKIEIAKILFADPAYHIAARYFLFNAALTMLALVIGIGVFAVLLKKTAHNNITLLPGTVAILAISTGLAIMLAELFFLAVFHVMTQAVVAQLYAATGVLAVCLCWLSSRELTVLIGGTKFSFASLVTLIFLAIVAILQFSFIDIAGGYDSTAFHVPYADVFVQNHGLAVDEDLIYPYHSFNINLFFSLALMIEHNIIYVQTVHSLFAALCMFGVYMFCRETGQRLCIALTLPIFFSTIYIIRVSRVMANVDLGGMFFVLMAVFALYLWSTKREAVWLLICSAIAFGVAMGSKYIIVVMALPIALCILLQARKRFWRPLWIYIVWAACFGLWWYIRNWIYTGNPVHPFATGIFGYYWWDASDMAGQMRALNQSYLPRDPTFIFQFPYLAYYNEVLRFQDTYLVIWMLYASTLLSWLMPRRLNILLIFCWIYFVSWLLGSQDPRHLMPALPLVFVYAGAVVERLYSMIVGIFGSANSRAPLFCRFAGVVIAVALVLLPLAYGLQRAREKFLLMHGRLLETGAAQEVALRKNPVTDLFYAANNIFGANDTVFELGLRNGRWFFKGHVVGNQFGPRGYLRVIMSVSDPGRGMVPERFEKLLRDDYGAQGFIIANNNFWYDRSEFDNYFDLMYRNSTGSVYRLSNP